MGTETKKEARPMNENTLTTTSTPAQQLIGALYLLALLALPLLALL